MVRDKLRLFIRIDALDSLFVLLTAPHLIRSVILMVLSMLDSM